MSKSKRNYLRIHRESLPEELQREVETPSCLAALCRDFEKVTGWSMRYAPADAAPALSDPLWSAPVDPGVGTSPGYLMLDRTSDSRAGVVSNLAEAIELATTLAQTLGELGQARQALWKREAELAAGVPVVAHPDERHLAERLASVLKAGAESIGCQSAALYLLDAATTELKMRSCWGLPPQRLAEPARPLRGAVADLEALSGSAVALEDNLLQDFWLVPEECGAAVCVPVSSPTTLLGTLWFFCNAPREFTDQQTNQAEIIAGRIAADLEREMLLTESVDIGRVKRQLHEAERLQERQCPTIAPLLDDWDLAGWTQQAEQVGGDFYDWATLSDDSLALMVGDALEQGVAAAVAAAGLRTALRTHAQYEADAGRVLTRVNRTLWTGSAGDQFAASFFGKLEPQTGRLQFALAGRMGALLLVHGAWQSLVYEALPLAMQPESDYQGREVHVPPGGVLLVYTDGVRDALDEAGRPLGDALLAEALLPRLAAPARELVDLARDVLHGHALDPRHDDCTLLIVRRL